MNFDYPILPGGADAPLSAGRTDHSELGEIVRKWLAALKLLALTGIWCHGRQAIAKERLLLEIFHRFHELSPVSPQFYQQHSHD